MTCAEAIQINRDTREQGSDEEQANDMLCMLLVHDIKWPADTAHVPLWTYSPEFDT